MDTQTVDSQFAALQQQTQTTAAALQTLGAKLQSAVDSGDQTAREWQLDLREIALAVQQEQNQVGALLQAIHQLVDSHLQQTQPQYQPAQYQQPIVYQQAPVQNSVPQQSGGMLQRFVGGGFGRAIMTGAGFGIGDDIVNDIFR
ncbi:hypothetical protein OG579_14945 [Williamsia herbipolensis]|uniref:Uncharacterized protein n=1 Tax=Williamsia herbipolensis TaxID=1603258 RepID=A0AAU4JZ56_9NOCA|nr:hypothetical protein [Williamsia herbipolensis]